MAGKGAKTATDDAPRKARSARGAKAREKLKQAAARVLERTGYHKMRITDVTGEAGVAAGLFYHYFPDLKSLTLEVLGDFVAASRDLQGIEKDVPRGDWYERMLAHHTLIVRAYAEHPGMMRCLLQMADEDEDFSRLLREHFIQQLNWLVVHTPRLFPDAQLDQQQALMVVYTLAGMGETLLRDYFVNREPALTDSKMSVEEITELLTVMLYRGLFLENPPAEKLRYTRNLEQMVKH